MSRDKRHFILPRVLAFASLAALAGCGTLYTEPQGAKDLESDSVILVGRIELVPPLKANEQDLKMGTFDPMDAKGALTGRAVLYLSDDSKAAGEKTMEAMNPLLEKTFFVKIPKDRRYMVYGSVLMYHRVTAVNQRQAVVDSNELMIPAPVQFDIKPGDRAIYVGTWRLHRDEFNEVNKAQIIDQYASASAEFQKKFGTRLTLRKALPGAGPATHSARK
jgi:hypothetical protein